MSNFILLLLIKCYTSTVVDMDQYHSRPVRISFW